MTTEEIKKMHNVQLKMMDIVHAFCKDHNIRYYLIAGSALGAVRHGGIIPWDVDIDIAMPRTDYQRFLELSKTCFNNQYEVLYYKNKRNLNSPHALVTLKDSVVKYIGGFETYGLYLDVFPLDACPDNQKLRDKQMHQIERLNRILGKKKGWKGRNFLFTLYHDLVALLLKPVSVDRINRCRDKVMRKYESTETTAECWCSMASGYKYTKQCMPQSYYGTPRLIDFEGRKYFVPEQVEKHLHQLYGDYMKFPSVEAQEKLMNSIQYAEWFEEDGTKCIVGSL